MKIFPPKKQQRLTSALKLREVNKRTHSALNPESQMFHLCQSATTGVKLRVFYTIQLLKMSTQTVALSDGRNSDNTSIHSDSVEEVHNVPLHVITRPIPPVLDEKKVQSLMNTIQVKYMATWCFVAILCFKRYFYVGFMGQIRPLNKIVVKHACFVK